MAKRTKEEVEASLKQMEQKESETTAKAEELTNTAVSIFRDENTGVWNLVRIKYNPATGLVGNIEAVPGGPDKAFASEKFKIAAVKEVGVV